jgi:phosphoesterase RecJ-like protein
MFIDSSEFPLPYEYRFLPLTGLVSEPPGDLADRTIVFLDCGNLERNPAEAFQRPGAHLLNIDHHHDNTRFGTVNHVVPEASCTAEIVYDLMNALGVQATPTIANALYVGLITDTGRFMYSNTTAAAHRMAAGLIDAGVDVHEIYRHVYEDVPYG